MDISVKKNDKQIIVAISGNLDLSHSQEVIDKIPLEDRKGFDVVFDFAKVDYISSAGLRMIIVFNKDAEECGKTISVINSNNMVKEIFANSGFDKIITIE